jgi:archaellum biogenesis ATPase FlaH
MFGSILAQCARLKPELIETIRPLQKPDNSLITKNSLTIAELTAALKQATGLFKRFFVLIDALNETPYQNKILSTVMQLIQICPNMKVLVTCTSDPASVWDDLGLSIRQMSSANVGLDIQKYVQYRLSSESNFHALSAEMRSEIQGKIFSNANGM